MTRSQIRQRIQEVLRDLPTLPEDKRSGLVIPESERHDRVVKDAPPANKSHELALTDQHIANMQANRELRGRHAKYAYRLARACLVMWWIVVLAQGIGKAFFDMEVWSSTVMIAITTGVTVNVLAAFLGVIRGLFGKDG